MYILAVFVLVGWEYPACPLWPIINLGTPEGCSALRLLRYRGGVAGERLEGVGYIHKCHGLEPPALSDVGIS